MKEKINLKTDWVSRRLKYFFILLISVTLSACGGGGDGDEGDGIIGTGADPGSVAIQGTAATGAALANATITAKSQSGAIKTATSDANGKFEIKELADNGPYLLRTDKENGDFLYSVAHKGGSDTINRNIHPYTDLIIRNWFETQGQDLDSAFNGSAAIPNMPTEQEINAIKDEIHNIVAQVLANNGATDIDLLSTPFDANSTGFDAFLDNAPVIINNNQITVIINDPVTNIQNIIINNIDLNTDLAATDDNAPTTPMNVRALLASSSEILVVWEASTDDKGVAGYNVYRNGELVGTTPYPVFRDQEGLSENTDYSYEIEAVDGRDQASEKSVATVSITLDTPDTTAPPAPANVQASTTGDDVSLNWEQTQIDDVYGFRILRGSVGNVSTEIANITATAYTDFNLVSATDYCYKVITYDAAGNESAASEEACAGTTGGVTPGPSSVSFSSATYQVNEDITSITITVNRGGDISEPISVDYATSNGTAVDGEDFSITSGTLNWAATDSTAKTFAMQIIADSATEGNETVNLALSSPSANTSLGSNATAILTIVDIVVGVCNGEITDSAITEDTTLSESCYKVPNGISVSNSAMLTINPGVRLEFASGTQLSVNGAATSLYAVGTQQQPIVFTAQETTPGPRKPRPVTGRVLCFLAATAPITSWIM